MNFNPVLRPSAALSPLRWDRRALFFAGVGMVLLAAATLSGSEVLLALGLATSGLAGLVIGMPVLEDFATHYHPLRILAASTAGAYGLGGALSWFAAQDPDVGGFSVVLLHYQISVSDLAIAQFAAVVFSALLLGIARAPAGNSIERRFAVDLSDALRAPSAGSMITRSAITMAFLQATFLFLGIVGYRSITTSDVVNPAALLMVSISPISPFLTGVLVARGQLVNPGRSRLPLYVGLSLVNSLWFFAQGRMAFLFACVIGVFGFAVVRRIDLRRGIVRNVILFAPLIIFVFVASQRIRYFQWVDESQKVNVFQALRLSVAEGSKLAESERSDSSSNNRMNLAMRPLTLNYPAEMINLRRNGGAGWVGFEEIRNSVLMALPRLVYPDKSGLLLSEGLFSERLGTSGTDNAETIFVSAIAGFSYLGLPIFAIIMWGMVKGITSLLLLARSWLLWSIGTVTVIGLAMSGGEGPFISWIVNLRSVAVIAPLVIIIEAWLRPQATAAHATRPIRANRSAVAPRKS